MTHGDNLLSVFKSIYLILFIFLFSGCVAPVYQNTTYGIDEFTKDSQQIAQGKTAILSLEDNESISLSQCRFTDDEKVIDGDILSVTLFCPKRPDRIAAIEMINQRTGFVIAEGRLCLPYLDPIDVSHLTLSEVRANIQSAYSEQINDIKVYINYKKRKERFVQVIGAHQTMIAIDGGTKLSQVLAKAGIPVNANLFKSMVVRNGVQIPIDLYKLIHQGDESQNIMIEGGDQIFLANGMDATVLVMGEVGNPIVIPVLYGSISLREALAIARGVIFTGNISCIQVIRGRLNEPKIYSLSWNKMMNISNKSLLLIPGDIVVISERAITQWNRFIDQLQPNVDCMQTTTDIYYLFR